MKVTEPSVRYSDHGRGYILLWRKALTSSVFQNANLWKVFTWCLLRANYQPIPLLFNGEEIQLKRGEFVTGRISASHELGMKESMVYRLLKTLANLGMISIKSNNRFSVITVCNYDSYQDYNYELEQPVNNRRTTDEQPVNTDKEYNTTKASNKVYIAKPDSVDSVIEYGNEIALDKSDCEAFFDYFNSNGWRVGGKAPMKDWKAALRNWKRNKNKFGGNGGKVASGVRQSDQTARATFRHTDEQLAKNSELEKSIGALLDQRDKRTGLI